MKKPEFHVFTNLAISMDGKISTKDRAHIDPSRYDRLMMDKIRSRAHAVLIGAATLRTFRQPAVVERKRYQLMRKARRLNPHPINVVLARHVDFEPSWPYFSDPHVERVIVVPEGTSEASLKPFHTLAHVFKYKKGPDFPEQIIGYLQKLECRNLLIEGGGGVLFPWAERNLVDEWNITVVPKIIGGESAPTMVEGEGFDAAHIKHYKLRKSFRRGDEVFLRYVKARDGV
ncbi:MAG: dihydrofolate reductase family protein [Deltaproteobacteria bacterium]|nr:dihydrofolate reductase family protein [Deltaproteobacteria bacterium]